MATKAAAAKAVSKAPKTSKWATLKKEAERRAAARPARPQQKPYVIDDVEPPIVIEPPDDKRLMLIAETLGPDGEFNPARVVPLLRALCADQFVRVWQMIPNNDPSAVEIMNLLANELINHFIISLRDVQQAAELPGGTEGSSS